MRAIHSNYKQQTKGTASCCEASSKANYCYLITPEKHKRLLSLRAQSLKAKQNAAYLHKRINDLIRQSEIEVDKDLDDDIIKILEEHQDAIEKEHSPDSVQRLFWKEQKKARAQQKSSSMRWHPMMVRWCLNLKLYLLLPTHY